MRMLSPLSIDVAWPRRTLSSTGLAPIGLPTAVPRAVPTAVIDVFENFDRLVDTFLHPTYADTVGFQPSCDVHETKNHFLVSFDMPGVKKEDITIEVQGNELVISGERQRGLREQDGEAALRMERSHGKFERRFTLPSTIAADQIEAHYENGVLNVALPKADATKGRTIQIQTGQGGFLSQLFGSKKETMKEIRDGKLS